MALVRIYDNEWWPVASYSRAEDGHDFYGPAVEVPDEVLAQYDAAAKAFNDAMDLLASFETP